MTNYNERLDEMLDGLHENGCSVIEGMNYPRSVAMGMYECDCCVLDTKQALTSLIKELVAEAKPGTWVDPEDTDDLKWQGYASGINEFEQNLLKALEEK